MPPAESMAGMNAKPILAIRIAAELLLAAYFLYSGIHQFRAPRFSLPTYMYVGSAILWLLLAVVFTADAARISRRLYSISK